MTYKIKIVATSQDVCYVVIIVCHIFFISLLIYTNIVYINI